MTTQSDPYVQSIYCIIFAYVLFIYYFIYVYKQPSIMQNKCVISTYKTIFQTYHPFLADNVPKGTILLCTPLLKQSCKLWCFPIAALAESYKDNLYINAPPTVGGKNHCIFRNHRFFT